MGRHTRGPWKAVKHAGTERGSFWGVWAGEERIAVLDATGEIDAANALLIAVAPELLAELGACQEVMDATAGQLTEGGWFSPETLESIANQLSEYAMKARAVIAKVEGK